MRPKEASRSAIAVALMRASHSVNDAAPLIQDACAFELFSGDEIELVRRDLLGRLKDGGCQPGDERLPDASLAAVLRAYPGYGNVILRMRYCEDRLEDAIRRGFQQYVILGAGMDTFCHRRPDLVSDLRVIEVDLPASQQMKREHLAAAGLQLGQNVAYCPVDLERDDLAAALCHAGLDRSRPTFFSWLGVSPYLTRAANLKTIDFISKSTAGQAEVVFNYLSSPAAGARTKALDKQPEARGSREPFRSYFEPAEVRAGVEGCGFGVVEDVGPGEMVRRYCTGRADRLHPRPSFRIAHLCKRPPLG